LGKTAAETVTMLREAFKEEALSQARVYDWFSRFKHGDMSLEDQPRSGRPSTSRTNENNRKISDAIMFDLRRKIDELEALTGVSWISCQRILTEELPTKRVVAKFVPRLLLEDQRANRLDVCREMKDQLKTDPDFFPKSSQEMNRGVMGMTRRQSNNEVKGKVHHLRNQKRRGKSHQM